LRAIRPGDLADDSTKMPAQHLLYFVPLLVGLAMAVYTDHADRRIPNWLTLPLALAGLLNALAWGFPISAGWAVLGLVVGFVLMFLKFAIGAAGGGDVKIMAAIGAWIGPIGALQVFLLYQIIGLFVVLFMAWKTGRLTRLLSNSMLIVANVLSLKQVGRAHVMETGRASRSLDRYMPDAVPMLVATLVVLALNVLATGHGS
jgi:prepilin peptidase CpaA